MTVEKIQYFKTMNLPNLDYNPQEQNILRSSLDLTTRLENRESLTSEQKKRIDVLRSRQYPANQQLGKSNIDRDFVMPFKVIKKWKERVETGRQRMGASNITFGDAQSIQEAEDALKPYQEPQVFERPSLPAYQRFGASSIRLNSDDESKETEKSTPRVYPGNYHMLKQNLNSEIVTKVKLCNQTESRMGLSNLDKQLNPPHVDKKQYPPTKLGQSQLGPSGNVKEVKKKSNHYQSKMGSESMPSEMKAKVKTEPAWFRGVGESELPPAPPRREYPQQQGLNVTSNKEWLPGGHKQAGKFKSEYPLGHCQGKSNIGPHLGVSEISKPQPRDYGHNHNFNKQSEVPVTKRRPSRMGESNFTMG